MNVLLTDHLVCPRCGPPFGLILLARDVEDRRVRGGELGCPNCRDAFDISEGFADLRAPPRSPPPPPDPAARSRDPDHVVRLAACLGVAEGPGFFVISRAQSTHGSALAGVVTGVESVVLGWEGRTSSGPGVSPMVCWPCLPFRDGAARGVVLGAPDVDEWWDEAVRVLAPGARVVLPDAPVGSRERIDAAGLESILDADGTLVAAAPTQRRPALSTIQNPIA